MKKLILLVSIASAIIACKPESSCTTCSTAPQKWTYDGKTVSVPNAISPMNMPLCDSFVFSPTLQTYVEPRFMYENMKLTCTNEEKKETPERCPCIENSDEKFNDGKNPFLKIAGIENFPSNVFEVKSGGKIVDRIVDYNNEKHYFQGYVLDTSSSIANFKHLSGEFNYSLTIYTDNSKKDILHIINGTISVIRTAQDCEVTGCQGSDANDPLLGN